MFQLMSFGFFTTSRISQQNFDYSFYIIDWKINRGFKEAFYDAKEVKTQLSEF